jgi:hypothetical protein
MLKEGESNSTKEGMFVDLHLDLKRIEGGNAPIPRVVTKVDKLALKIVQFDYIRMGAGVLDGKDYREISHNARGEQSFFAKEEIWKPFRKRHEEAVQSVEAELGSLDGYIASNPHFTSRSEAAQARDNTWRAKVAGPMKGNFNRAHGELEAEVDKDEPRKLLERALAQLARVNIRGAAFIQDRGNENLVKELNRLTYEMKKRFDRAPARN